MESSGTFKQNGRWRLLLSAYCAAGLIDQQRADTLIDLGEQLASVNAANFQHLNLSGPSLGEAIRNKRLEMLRAAPL